MEHPFNLSEAKHRTSVYDLLSISLLIFISLFSCLRFRYLPQFIDGYYHLACANAFEKSGGWVGVDWWSFAPAGRPHLYPPFYHFVLVFLKSIGFSGINSVRVTEMLIVPLFFLLLWVILRKEISKCSSFFFLLISSSFFSFYSSVSANVPASIATILGIAGWFFLKKKRFLSSILMFSCAFYTHNGMPWVFIVSLLVLAIFNRSWRKYSLVTVAVSLLLAAPLIIHQVKYFDYVSLAILHEVEFSHFSIFIIAFGIFSFIFNIKRKDFYRLLFCGYVIGSIMIFVKYPYRFFSAQGMLGFIIYASLLLEHIFYRMDLRRNKTKLFFGCVIAYLFILHSTIDLHEGKVEFNPVNSTYYNIASGNFIDTLEFNSLFYPQHYLPIVDVIRANTKESDIIASNIKTVSQIFSALSRRPSSKSILGEIKQFRQIDPYLYAKIIVWFKPQDSALVSLRERLRLLLIYENDVAFVYLNPFAPAEFVYFKSRMPFRLVAAIFLFFLFIFLLDNVKIVHYREWGCLKRRHDE